MDTPQPQLPLWCTTHRTLYRPRSHLQVTGKILHRQHQGKSWILGSTVLRVTALEGPLGILQVSLRYLVQRSHKRSLPTATDHAPRVPSPLKALHQAEPSSSTPRDDSDLLAVPHSSRRLKSHLEKSRNLPNFRTLITAVRPPKRPLFPLRHKGRLRGVHKFPIT